MALLLLALAAGAIDPVTNFTAACRQERSATHCSCVVDAMLADPGGRFFIDMTGATTLPEAQQMSGYAALLQRYGVDAAGGSALRLRGQAIGDAAVASCP